MYVCMYVCMYVYIYIYIYIYVYICICVCVCLCVSIYIHDISSYIYIYGVTHCGAGYRAEVPHWCQGECNSEIAK
jgi:hypothetical protein